MSSEIYELMKRPDELLRGRPRPPPPALRGGLACARWCAGRSSASPTLPDDAFVHAHQANFETIHTHDVEAERSGLVGRSGARCAGGGRAERHTTLRGWLDGGVPRA